MEPISAGGGGAGGSAGSAGAGGGGAAGGAGGGSTVGHGHHHHYGHGPHGNQQQWLASFHRGAVLDVTADFFGKRFASGGAEGEIKVWDLDEEGMWGVTGTVRGAHAGAVTCLSWAHPEFGQILASSSYDNTVGIWQEHDTELQPGGGKSSNWVPKAQLKESKKSVEALEFSPRHLGLRLAAASSDGHVRVYEASDMMSLLYWPPQEVFLADTSTEGLTSLSWNQSTVDPPTLATAGHDGTPRVWQLAEGLQQQPQQKQHGADAGDTSSGNAGGASDKQWVRICQLQSHQHNTSVRDVAWAPNVGRSFHLIATVGADGIKIHTLRRDFDRDNAMTYDGTVHLNTSYGEAWRVSWNATGTVLAASVEDGGVELYRRNLEGHWRMVGTAPPMDSTTIRTSLPRDQQLMTAPGGGGAGGAGGGGNVAAATSGAGLDYV